MEKKHSHHQVAAAAISSGNPWSRMVRSQKAISWEHRALYLS